MIPTIPIKIDGVVIGHISMFDEVTKAYIDKLLQFSLAFKEKDDKPVPVYFELVPVANPPTPFHVQE